MVLAAHCWAESLCQASSEVKLDNTDKTNWRHSTDISQQCSYLLQARFGPKAGLSWNWVQMKAES